MHLAGTDLAKSMDHLEGACSPEISLKRRPKHKHLSFRFRDPIQRRIPEIVACRILMSAWSFEPLATFLFYGLAAPRPKWMAHSFTRCLFCATLKASRSRHTQFRFPDHEACFCLPSGSPGAAFFCRGHGKGAGFGFCWGLGFRPCPNPDAKRQCAGCQCKLGPACNSTEFRERSEQVLDRHARR